MNDMVYQEFLEHSFETVKALDECAPKTRLAYLSNYIFDFTTYDQEIDELFASKAVEVCGAINDSVTFSYIEQPENYKWFLLMCNMPFFFDRIEWGTSIRGAWWRKSIKLDSCGLWIGEEQASEMTFGLHEWERFIDAMTLFSRKTE